MPGLIVHEWIARRGGSENVLEAMARTFPDADIRCLWNDDPERFAAERVTESWLARTPLRHSKAIALPFMPATWSHIDVQEKDFVLVSSHLFAHHIGGRLPLAGPKKYVYVHTPARYIWAPELDPRGRHLAARLMAPMLKRLDSARASQGATFAANSEYVRERIRRVWEQEATVIYPPVDIEKIQAVPDWRVALRGDDLRILEALPSEFLLGASRFVPYKDLETVIRVGEAARLPVVLAGSGPQRGELVARGERATVPVLIVERPSDQLLYALYQCALVFVFPAVDDFGIMPVEAMSLGTPAIVVSRGGAQESIRALRGGIVLPSIDGAALVRGVEDALALDMSFAVSSAAGAFGATVFTDRLRRWMGMSAMPSKRS